MFTTTDFIAYQQVLPPYEQAVADETLRQQIATQIQEACALLMQLDELQLCEVKVAVTDGQVVLSGVVQCSRLRRLAEGIAKSRSEAVGVTSQIRLVGEPPVPNDSLPPHSPLLILMAVTEQT